MKFAYISEQH